MTVRRVNGQGYDCLSVGQACDSRKDFFLKWVKVSPLPAKRMTTLTSFSSLERAREKEKNHMAAVRLTVLR